MLGWPITQPITGALRFMQIVSSPDGTHVYFIRHLPNKHDTFSLRRWPNIRPTMAQPIVFEGYFL